MPASEWTVTGDQPRRGRSGPDTGTDQGGEGSELADEAVLNGGAADVDEEDAKGFLRAKGVDEAG